MEHAEVRELLELAAAEPGGIDALLRGAAPESQPINEHLATCAGCRKELESLRGSAAAIRDVIRGIPTPELRARTLELVASAGRQRDGHAPAKRSRFALRLLVPAATLAAAAAVLVAGAVVWRAVDTRLSAADARIAEQGRAIAGLTRVTDWTLRLGAAADARLVHLSAAAGSSTASGTVLFSAGSGEVLMVATGLPAAPDGYEYRCWIDQGSGRVQIGEMYNAGAVAYWGGTADQLRGIQGRFTLGVTLTSQVASGTPGETVLVSTQ